MGQVETKSAQQQASITTTPQSATAVPVPGKATAVMAQTPQTAAWNGTAYKGSVFAAGALPWASNDDGLKALERFVSTSEAKVRSLATSRLSNALAPDAVIAEVAEELAEDFERVELRLASSSIEATETTSELDRLGLAIGKLFTLARQHNVRMRESGLERVFDGEDQLRLRFSYPGGRANRAELYYDQNIVQVDRKRGTTDGKSLATSLSDEQTAQGQGETRDDLIRQIQHLGSALAEAIKTGYEEAKQAIEEPSAPRNPELLEKLAEVAATLILGHANIALSVSLGSIAKAIDKSLGMTSAVGRYATKQVGAKMTRSLLTGFIAGGADAAKATASTVVTHVNQPTPSVTPTASAARQPGDEKLSAKSIFLKATRRNTVEKALGIEAEFIKYVGELKRQPVETLQTILDCIGAAQLIDVTDRFRRLIVREWVNFGKQAMEQGEEVRDAAHRPPHASKLDNFLAPYGVLRITMSIDDRGTTRFVGAELPGVSDAVVWQIKAAPDRLATVHLHRRIELRNTAEQSLVAAFELDASGKPLLTALTADARLALARLANAMYAPRSVVAQFRIKPSDVDVRAGVEAVIAQLSAIGCERIKDAG